MSDAERLLVQPALQDGDRAAIGLLVEYRDSYWLTQSTAQCFRVVDFVRPTVDWDPARQAWGEHSADACDRAILLTALHLAGHTAVTDPLGPHWRHLDRSALAAVLRAVAVSAGARAQVADAGSVPLGGYGGPESNRRARMDNQ